MNSPSLQTKRVLWIAPWLALGLLIAGPAASAATAPAHADTAVTAAKSALTLTGSAAGGVKTGEFQDSVTFIFTEKNTGSAVGGDSLTLESVTNGNIVNVSCVLPSGFLFQPDGNVCEPGSVRPGQTTSSVVDVTVTSSSGTTMSARLCLTNGNGSTGACKTVSVSIL